MFQSLMFKFLLDMAGKAIIVFGTTIVAKGYVDQSTASEITGGLTAGLGALITAGLKTLADHKATKAFVPHVNEH